MSHPTAEGARGAHPGHDEHPADPTLAHHFDNHQHQFEAGKLGIWLFLVQEILFFGGLFCAYAVYRSLHPEVFEYAHYYLDTKWGAINTCVLIISSVTAAWAVRNAQLQQVKLLTMNIVITILCGFGFMGIKFIEYSHKIHDGLLPGMHYQPTERAWEVPHYKEKWGTPPGRTASTEHEATEHGHEAAEHEAVEGGHKHAAPKPGPLPVGTERLVGPHEFNVEPANVQRFFSIYFCMTGLHGIHVLLGIGLWIWLLIRVRRGEFGPKYFGPIDFAALYWHLVDLIWIYLFPLLYLIH
jgi:cytochrome c oxidase subunit 3